jgi:hypothetical protein
MDHPSHFHLQDVHVSPFLHLSYHRFTSIILLLPLICDLMPLRTRVPIPNQVSAASGPTLEYLLQHRQTTICRFSCSFFLLSSTSL